MSKSDAKTVLTKLQYVTIWDETVLKIHMISKTPKVQVI